MLQTKAQIPYEDLDRPPRDTFPIFKPAVRYISSLDSIAGEIFDSITSPKAYMINTYKLGNGYSWLIAVKQKNRYAVFDPFENSGYAESFTVKTQQFDGKGSEELILEWSFYAGHSGWENAIHERTGGIHIWNLDKIEKLFDLGTYYSHESWWTQYSEDSTGTLFYDEREVINSGGESYCNIYDVKIEKQQLTIQKKTCTIPGAIDTVTIDPVIHSYRLTKKGLIKQK